MSRYQFALSLGVASTLGLFTVAGCIVRDVAVEEPTTKLSFATRLPQPAVDKIDLLVVVDNSSSMADKQRILADALPDLVRGVVEPRCVEQVSRRPTSARADVTKPDGEQCPPGSEPAFTPVTDMHLGVISTSIGTYGLDACAPSPERHDDDDARLLARGVDGAPVAAAGDLHFLAWYPDVPANADKRRHPAPPVPATTSLDDLDASFRQLVLGVGDDGCGLEAQLESAYRFLVQPDPAKSTRIEGGAPVSVDVDRELLRQRAAFLRPDSLVAVVMLTDEDDASVDPSSFRGSGWRFLERDPLPHATAACDAAPASAACTSCAFAPSDPSCAVGGGTFSKEEDDLNVRFHRMKQRFGVDPRYPIARYVDGFTEKNVPRRDDEHDETGRYVAKAACTNPLFAASLPTGAPGEGLCDLPLGPRTADLVYLAVIGGVPTSLLPDVNDPDAVVDWTPILGRDLSAFDAAGIDPHMIASTTPRPGLSTGPGLPDPVHGREWHTGGRDLELACAFDLYEREGDTIVPIERACADPATCDCDGKKDIPLCKEGEPDVQIRGKAYPTIRELEVVKQLGAHGIPASLCPAQLTEPDRDDYGYRPAMRAILGRFERGLQACLPRALERVDAEGDVSCLVVAILAEDSDVTCERAGLAPLEPRLLAPMKKELEEREGLSVSQARVCRLPQVAVAPGETCRYDTDRMGYCYAEGVPGVGCAHSLQFTKPVETLVGARFSLQCIQVLASGGG